MTKPALTPLHEARRAAAKELGVKASDPRAIRLAALQVAYDQVQVQLAAGKTIDVDAMLKLDSALADARASAASVPKVEIAIVEGLVGICPVCKAEVHPYEPPPALTRLPVSTETKDVSKTETSPPPKPPASNVLEIGHAQFMAARRSEA